MGMSLGLGAQCLARMVTCYLHIATVRIYLRRHIQAGTFDGVDLEYIFDELKKTHEVYHQNVLLEDPRLDLSDAEEINFDGRDAMSMHLMIGRYLFPGMD